MNKFYEVVAKCGHVGKRNYYRGVFYERAETGKIAAMIVRGRGRVKHNHKDAILSVREITREQYLTGREQVAGEAYFQCKNIQEQAMHWDEISGNIFYEPRYEESEVERKPRFRRHQKDKPFNWRNYDWDDIV